MPRGEFTDCIIDLTGQFEGRLDYPGSVAVAWASQLPPDLGRLLLTVHRREQLMGQLFYGAMYEPIVIPDALLAHLQLVTATKLRRAECFTLSWRHSGDQPGGRTTIWLQPSIPLRFVFDAAESVPIDTGMLNRFAQEASSTRGLVIDLTTTLDEVEADADLMLQTAREPSVVLF